MKALQELIMRPTGFPRRSPRAPTRTRVRFGPATWLLVLLLGIVLRGTAACAEKPRYVVVASRAARPALEPLLAHRSRACEVTFSSREELASEDGTLSPEALKRRVRDQGPSGRPPVFLLLVGDTAPGSPLAPLPTHPSRFDVWYGTLGGNLMAAERRLCDPAPLDVVRSSIDRVAPMTPEERARSLEDHLYLYNLLGDPALKVAYAGALARFLARQAADGRSWEVEGEAAGLEEGQALITLEAQRTAFPVPLKACRPEAEEGWKQTMLENYAAANRRVLAEAAAPVKGGRFRTELPAEADGKPLQAGTYLVKAFAWSDAASAAGVTTVAWTPPSDGTGK